MRHGWWRSNAVWLIALVALTSYGIGTVYALELREAGPGHATRFELIDEGARGGYAGAKLGVAKLTEHPPDAALDVPERARLLIAEVPVLDGGTTIACLNVTLRESGGDQRTWADATAATGWQRPLGMTNACFADEERGVVQVPFLVPDDAPGPFVIEGYSAAAASLGVRFEVTPR